MCYWRVRWVRILFHTQQSKIWKLLKKPKTDYFLYFGRRQNCISLVIGDCCQNYYHLSFHGMQLLNLLIVVVKNIPLLPKRWTKILSSDKKPCVAYCVLCGSHFVGGKSTESLTSTTLFYWQSHILISMPLFFGSST